MVAGPSACRRCSDDVVMASDRPKDYACAASQFHRGFRARGGRPMAAERGLVAGGAGFIGASVVEALGNRGTSVLVVDDLSPGSAANLHHVRGDVEMVKVDIRDAALVRQGVDKFPPPGGCPPPAR